MAMGTVSPKGREDARSWLALNACGLIFILAGRTAGRGWMEGTAGLFLAAMYFAFAVLLLAIRHVPLPAIGRFGGIIVSSVLLMIVLGKALSEVL